MGKKGAAAALLLGLAVRLAVLAGASAPVERWVRERWGDGRLVRATLNLELGGAHGAAEAEEAAETAPPSDEAEAAAESAPPAFLPLSAAVSPAPTDAPTPQEPERAAAIRAVDLSGAPTVRNATSLDVDLDTLAAEGLSLRLDPSGPQVLILHTHSSEAYTPDGADRYEPSDPYRTEDPTQNVIRVGDALAEALEAKGLTVLHDREIYDWPSYTGSYGRSGAAAAQYLADYPTLRVVIDLHRDALGSGDVVYKTAAVLGGRQCAQVMTVVGTGENGLPHPAWRENLKLAMYLQNAVDARYPTLTRPIALVSERYNQHLSTGMLILEVGSNGNTLREALGAAALFGDAAGDALVKLLGDGAG